MQQHLYSAPKADLSDPARSQDGSRPLSIKLAGALIALYAAVGFAKASAVGPGLHGWLLWVAIGFVIFFSSIAASAVMFRLRWARWLLGALTALNVCAAPAAVFHTSAPLIRLALAAQAVLGLGVLLLIFLPASLRWYRPNNSSKPTPLRGAA
ncbi:hypothetical protein PAGU2638_28330 [Lysobacter sp. PAGU 2638]